MKKIMIVMLLLVPSIAFAQSANGPMSTLFGDIIQIVAYGAVIALSGLLALTAKWAAAKFKTTIPDAWMTNANNWLDKGIAYAEQWAKNQVAANKTINSNDKLNTAVQFVLSMSDDKTLVSKTEAELQKLIEARLGEHNGTVESAAVLTIPPVEAKMLTTSDSGSVKLHMSDGSDHEISDLLTKAGFVKAPAIVPSAIVAPGNTRPQGGFIKVGLMGAMAMVAAIALFVGCTAGCGAGTQIEQGATQAGSDIVSCAQAEAAATKSGVSIVTVTLEVVNIIEMFVANPVSAITTLIQQAIQKYGEPLVACAFNKWEAQHGAIGAGSGSAQTSQPDPRVVAVQKEIDQRGWSKYK